MTTARKCIANTLLVFLLIGLIGAPASVSAAVELELSAETAVLIEAKSGMVLYARDAEKPLPPASLTKIMTLLLAMEELKRGIVDWETVVIVSQRAWETGGSQMFLNINQQVTFEELIKGIAIISANDACIAVAEHLFGSVDAFVHRMNERAAELGLEQTHFTNPHGLHHPDHQTSALDMARLAAYFVQNYPEAAAFQAMREFTFNEIRQFNRNPLLGSYPGADGVKTGSTSEAGYCLAATSMQDGMRLVSVVMNTPSNEHRGRDSRVLLEYGFRNFKVETIHEKEAVVASVSVRRGKQRELDLIAASPAAVVMPVRDEYPVEERLVIPAAVSAPVEAGEKIGTLQLLNPAGEVVEEIELFASESMEQLGWFRSMLRSIGDFFVGLWNSIFGN